MNLTKDADIIICTLYKEYLIKSDTLSKSKSKVFTENELKSLFSEFDSEDIDDLLNELKITKLIERNILGTVTLSKDSIIYMENRFKNNLKEITEFITKFIP